MTRAWREANLKASVIQTTEANDFPIRFTSPARIARDFRPRKQVVAMSVSCRQGRRVVTPITAGINSAVNPTLEVSIQVIRRAQVLPEFGHCEIFRPPAVTSLNHERSIGIER